MTKPRAGTRSFAPLALCIALLTSGALAACSKNATIIGSGTASKPGTSGLTGTPKPGPRIGNPGEGTLYVGPGLDKSKRKALPLISSSIRNCLGVDEKIFEVNAAMMANQNASVSTDDKGRVPFLPPSYDIVEQGQPAVKDVLEIERIFLDDPAALRRASVYGSALDDLPYMVATQTVANVVAWNVDVEKLDCDGTAAAREFLDRCLLGEEDAILDEAATHLGSDKACGSSDAFTKRKALATFLASYLFLRVR